MTTSPSALETSLIELLSNDPNVTANREQLLEQWNIAKTKKLPFREQINKSKLVHEKNYQAAIGQVMGLEFFPQLPDLPEEEIEIFVSKIPLRYVKKHEFFPVSMGNDCLTLAVNSPWPTTPFEDAANILHKKYKLVLSTKDIIIDAINRGYDRGTGTAEEAAEDLAENNDLNDLFDFSREEAEDLLDAEDEEPIKKLVNSILFQSIKDGASDIHMDPTARDTHVRYRIDGVMHPMTTVPQQGHRALVNRIKVMAGLDISKKNQPQDGRTMVLLAGKNIDIRVSVLPTIHGERAVLRILNQSKGVLKLQDMGMSSQQEESMEKLVKLPHGVILVTGPTGSGKTTTLYAALRLLDKEERTIITVEDPVEYKVTGYGQVQVNEKVGLTFAAGLRSILRQDPDVIMIGEMRDAETAQIAIQASLTGHLVLSTIHTNDSPSTVIRLIDMGIEAFLVSSTIAGILAQRLVRSLCNNCKKPISMTVEELQKAGIPKDLLSQEYSGQIFREEGCDQCHHTGYKGRMGVYELLVLNDQVRQSIARGEDSNIIKKIAVENGFHPMSYDCGRKVLNGRTSLDEMLRVVYTEEE